MGPGCGTKVGVWCGGVGWGVMWDQGGGVLQNLGGGMVWDQVGCDMERGVGPRWGCDMECGVRPRRRCDVERSVGPGWGCDVGPGCWCSVGPGWGCDVCRTSMWVWCGTRVGTRMVVWCGTRVYVYCCCCCCDVLGSASSEPTKSRLAMLAENRSISPLTTISGT